MAIRFLCGSCRQPIEVDDAWALRTVLCPFCRTTITAPDASTLTDLAQIPAASPASPFAHASAQEALARPANPKMGNPVAVASFVLASLVVVLWGVTFVIAEAHALEVKDFAESLQRAAAGSKAPMQAWADFLNSRGGVMPGWMVAIGLTNIVAILSLLAAMVCGGIGLRRPYRRGLAIAALAICLGMIGFVGLAAFATGV